MALVTCEDCGTVQEFSIFEGTTPCRACGASADHLSPIADGSDAAPDSSRSYTVLIAEDDDAFRETVGRWSEIGDRWHVRATPNGKEALTAVDEAVDVLVLDRRMPELSGHELIERLGETPFDGDVLVVSAYEASTDLNEADVDGYLTKPVSREAYVDALEWLATV